MVANNQLVNESRSGTLTSSLVASALVLLTFGVAQARMPIGIPTPPFGLQETPAMYASDASYASNVHGPYTHYVDNSGNCSDSGSGTEATPRCSLPTRLNAGDVVQVHGGPYRPQSDVRIVVSGTSAAPIFITGVIANGNRPVFDSVDSNGKLYIDGSYAIVENIEFATSGLRLGNESASDHLSARNVEVNWHEKNCISVRGDYIVVADSELHHCIDNTKDRHGFQVLAGSNHVWVLRNHIHHNGGNGIQYTHNAESNPPDYVFIGGNLIHSDREVGIASKWVRRSVVSSNIIHSVRASQRGQQFCFDDNSACMTPESATNGPGIHFGADGFPVEKWVIHNLIYDTNHCIRVEEANKARIIGNICADIVGAGVMLEKRADDLIISNNTFVRTGQNQNDSVVKQYWRNGFTVDFQNNLIINPGHTLWFESRSVMNTIDFNNNLLWNNGQNFSIRWANRQTTARSLNDLRSLMQPDVHEFQNNIVSDPRFQVAARSEYTRAYFAPPANIPVTDGANNQLLEL
ncbi:MAG: right-handed parallel beta-helix repeat-containing protein, partial [Pseudomonadota bacterium]